MDRPAHTDAVLLHELQVHQIELEMSVEALKASQHALSVSRDQYLGLYERAPVGYCTLDARGHIVQINPVGANLLGVHRDGAMSQPFLASVAPPDQANWLSAWAHVVQQDAPEDLELCVRGADGRGQAVHACLQRHPGEAQALEVFVVLNDVTERKQLEAALNRHRQHLEQLVVEGTAALRDAKEAAEAGSRAKSEFLANMSHEIRTPMNAIIGFASLMREEGPSPVQSQRLGIILDASAHLMDIINDVLDLAQVEAGKMTLAPVQVSLPRLLADVSALVSPQAAAKGVHIRTEHSVLPAWVMADPTRLRQALLNYATNAVKFTEHGQIVLRCDVLPEVSQADCHVRFEVRDTGIGIEPLVMARLFQPFEQANASATRCHGGTGLGLAITRRIAQQMGGDAGASSQPGVGSVFWFTARLPLVLPTPSPHDVSA
ncbi:PAS domain S-box-containing protein [Aquabacterium commune]|uniref:Virulence sensor protein BvgS n=1 Tax=Aquabacterium commune TaxID=70586 RepID=A0A4R6RJ60_9BURK|nr:PAS domain-containing hybrid sensor histidine kinase/response regulator [Aquabacterium commune]TDP86135.1 PAS domain S-box-containing protein [Aquabacterium commune]